KSERIIGEIIGGSNPRSVEEPDELLKKLDFLTKNYVYQLEEVIDEILKKLF
ncbi:14193_t:CDS:1, partial [Funneliformis geosporum]